MWRSLDILGAFLIAAIITWVLMPPEWDPMILWKERQEGWPKREDQPPPRYSSYHWVWLCLCLSLFVAALCTAAGYLTGPSK